MRSATSPATSSAVPGEPSHLRGAKQLAAPAVPLDMARIAYAGQPAWIAVFVECLAAMAIAIGGHTR